MKFNIVITTQEEKGVKEYISNVCNLRITKNYTRVYLELISLIKAEFNLQEEKIIDIILRDLKGEDICLFYKEKNDIKYIYMYD